VIFRRTMSTVSLKSEHCARRCVENSSSAAAVAQRITQRGLTLLEMLISLSILGAIVVGITKLAQDAADDTRASVTALHTRTVGEAASAYIKDNYAAIAAIASATTPALIRVADLVATGYLPAGYSVVNARSQATCVLVLEPTANRLTGLVMTEGGDTLDDLTLGQVASLIGGAGGGLYSSAPTVARGAMGGYSFPVGAYGNPNHAGMRCDGSPGNVSVAAGHPIMSLPYADGVQASSTLYRDAVPGNPALNTMNTPILMGSGSQQTAGNPCPTNGAIGRSATGAVLACDGGVWKQGGSAFWQDPVATFAALPACNAAALNHTRVVQTPGVGSGRRAYTCNGAGAWNSLSVNDAGSLVVPGTATVEKLDGRLEIVPVRTAGTACTPNGSLARTVTGGILFCESGLWKGAGSVKPTRIAAASSGGVGGGGVGVACAATETVTGGGGTCISPPGYNFLYYSVPNGNGWYIACDSPNRSTYMYFTVYATCAPL
jgi:prepilin-type N-terminal cleavage/methylation domain-containing protein